jgi:hypothetical protein
MRIRTGLKVLIASSVLGIAISVLLFFTCPFAGQLAFGAQVREMHAEQAPAHGAPQSAHEAQSPAAADPHAQQEPQAKEQPQGLSVMFMFDPKVRSYPAQETRVLGIEVSLVGIAVLLVLSALAVQILRQRPVNLFGHLVISRAMAALIVLIAAWNVIFAAFLLGVEAFGFREL